MDILPGIILGAVQGLTEFLPISSSGHLILVRSLLDLQTVDGLAVDAILQLATALAVLIYFWRELVDLARSAIGWLTTKKIESAQRSMILALLIGTVPAVIFGLLLEDIMATTFRNPVIVFGTLLIGGALMYAAELFAGRRQQRELTWRRGLAIGFFQCLALVPGMSRSGSTISGGLFMGLPREQAAKFSFLLALPIILGSGGKKLIELGGQGQLVDLGLGLAFGFMTAFLVGLAAIHFLLRFLRQHSLRVFVAYRVMLAAIVFWLFYLGVI